MHRHTTAVRPDSSTTLTRPSKLHFSVWLQTCSDHRWTHLHIPFPLVRIQLARPEPDDIMQSHGGKPLKKHYPIEIHSYTLELRGISDQYSTILISNKSNNQSLMVRGCTLGRLSGTDHFCRSSINSQKYMKTLGQHVRPSRPHLFQMSILLHFLKPHCAHVWKHEGRRLSGPCWFVSSPHETICEEFPREKCNKNTVYLCKSDMFYRSSIQYSLFFSNIRK